MKWIVSIALLLLATATFGADTKQAPSGQVTKTGKLSSSLNDDKTIVAVLHVEDLDPPAAKGKAKKKNAPLNTSIDLIAKGDLATKLADFITKNSLIEVTGTLADNKMTVSAVKEIPDPAAKKKGK